MGSNFRRSLISIVTCSLIAAAIMTFAAAWGKPAGKLY
jgi:hypothetical protein